MILRIALILITLVPFFLITANQTAGQTRESPPKNYQPKKQGDFSNALDCKKYPAPGIMITDWVFGKFDNPSQINEKITVTRIIPYKFRQNWGFRIWMMAEKGFLPKMNFKETLVAPSPVPGWKQAVANQPWVKVADDSRSAFTYDTQNPRERHFMYEIIWIVDIKIDPKGPWYIELEMNGKKICRFDFELK